MAAIHAGYKPEEMAAKSVEDRAMIIALYRTKLQIDAIMAHEQAKNAEIAARKGKKRR